MSALRVTEDDVEEAPRGKRVLLIAAYYPPSTAAAAIRARNLVRNLQALGHQVRVVTTPAQGDGETPPESRPVRYLNVETFARSVMRREQDAGGRPTPPRPWQRNLRAFATRLLFPDLFAPWIPAAVAAARREGRDADIVMSTGAASAHVVARIVRGHRPVVVDINDLWWRNSTHSNHRHGLIRELANHRLERMIVRGATTVVVPVRQQGLEVERRWARPATTVLTGFDPAEFQQHSLRAASGPKEIVFAGTMYGDFRLDTLLTALAEGRAAHGWTPDDLRISFFGTGSGAAIDAAESRGVAELVDGTPPIPRPELLRHLAAADALILPLYDQDPYHLPMRFFEFVGAGRPMIGIGAASAPAAQLIDEHGLGVVCTDTASLVAALERIVSGARLPDMPSQARAAFETATTQPVLQQLIDKTTRAVGD
jgi:glycosyltransferase involved in cell wall biosynthesis